MVELDLKDKKLLYWLDWNSRSTNKALGKKIGLTEQAVGYRLKKLQEKGIIEHFITFVNTISLGYTHYKVFVKLHNTTSKIEQNFISLLTDNPNIRWVASTSGKYDVTFSVLAKTPSKFIDIFRKIQSDFGKYIIEKNVAINVSSPGFTRAYLIDAKESTKRDYESNTEVQKLDETDIKILKSISIDSRKSIVDITKEIDSTVDIVKYRLKKLRQRNIINGFTINLNLQKINYEYYSIFFHTHNLNDELEKKIENFALSHSCVRFIVKAIGTYDTQLEFEVKNYTELDKNLKEFRHLFSEHIRDFEILRVTKEYKTDFFPFSLSEGKL